MLHSMSERILFEIEKKGLTPHAVEKALGFGNGAIRRFSTNSPSIDKIIKLSNFLNISIEYLIYGTINKSTDDELYSTLTVDEKNLLRLYRKTTDKGRDLIQEAITEIWTKNQCPKNKLSTSSTNENEISVTG